MSAPRPRNLILIVADTLRADRLGCYGYPHELTPAIDSLAARGVMYRNNHSQCAWTVPSMVSMMSGLYVTQSERELPGYQSTLAETFQRAGFTTAAFLGNQVLSERGFDRGYDHFSCDIERNGFMLDLVDKFRVWFEDNRDEIASSSGLLLWIHPNDPHAPYDRTQWSEANSYARHDQKEIMPRWRSAQTELAEIPGMFQRVARDLSRTSVLYDGEVARLDKGVAELLDFLKAEGELEDSLIVFASDHGEMLGEQRRYPRDVDLEAAESYGIKGLLQVGHGTFYEEVWNTPLILAGPGIPEGVVSEGLSANLDVFPTVCAAFGVDPPAGLHGESLLGGKDAERRRVFAFAHGTTAVYEASGLKLLSHSRERFGLEGDGPSPVELFDLSLDPGEGIDYSVERPEETERLREMVEVWHRRFAREAEITEPPERLEMLRALGYAE